MRVKWNNIQFPCVDWKCELRMVYNRSRVLLRPDRAVRTYGGKMITLHVHDRGHEGHEGECPTEEAHPAAATPPRTSGTTAKKSFTTTAQAYTALWSGYKNLMSQGYM